MKAKSVLVGMASTLLLVAASSCSPNSRPEISVCTEATKIVVDNIMTRTSIRQFTAQQVGKDTLESLVRAGMAAPTAVNAQPWGFVVVTERAVLDSLDAAHPYSHLKGAPAAIVVCGDMGRALEGIGREYWVQDCSAASENILLAAHAYDLGAVWCGVYPNPERIPGVKRVLNLPDSIVPLNVITIGHPANPNQQPKDKWDATRVHYDKW